MRLVVKEAEVCPARTEDYSKVSEEEGWQRDCQSYYHENELQMEVPRRAVSG